MSWDQKDNLNKAYRSLKRFHRKLTGASTLTRMKNGRLKRCSRISSFHMSVMTQRCFQFLVTNSSNESTSQNDVWSGSSAPFTSLSRRSAILSIFWSKPSLQKSCFSTRYSATEFFPAQIPCSLWSASRGLILYHNCLPPHNPTSIVL